MYVCVCLYIGLAGSFGALLVGGCGTRAVSRKTPIYFIICKFGDNGGILELDL